MRLIARFVLLLATVVLFACGGGVTKENYDKLENGMTEAEVEDLLGKPTDSAGGGIGNVVSGSTKIWKDGDKEISVTFVNGKVTLFVSKNL